MSKPIFQLVDELPTNNLTVKALHTLDFVIPGEWQNIVGFTNTIKAVTGETDEDLIQQIGERAIWLYNDKSQGYQRALWLYETVNSAGGTLGAAAMANKISQDIGFLGFLGNITPKPEKAQTIDLSLKVVTELLAFCQINGIPGDSIGDFVMSLGDYGGESLMRMVALICFDGLIPLGPDFILKAQSNLNQAQPSDFQQNPVFKQMESLIPGGNTAGKLGFIGESFSSISGWMGNFAASKGLTPQNVMANLQTVVEVSADKFDYVAGFLDMSTNYYYHTGVQTLARRLIERASAEI
ncbi:hypothetical protein NG798_10115 [Ancylothrix sp. C2]|uniref:hypothetical protein n=1 Tax=Ancylothrix sp. D3o TaxID=2953691 RepID=UPI0021BABE69|nr:hypothetical protein [Ancylothrix sp. D3o]MCT7950140.1 hypothetical protein [Ancylothrix sp. D3o]